MPEELLRNRNKHEKKVHPHEPKRPPGDGKVEEFREFLLKLVRRGGARFREFHDAVQGNSVEQVRAAMRQCKDEEILQWLQVYLKR
jgi:hypothetical protein